MVRHVRGTHFEYVVAGCVAVCAAAHERDTDDRGENLLDPHGVLPCGAKNPSGAWIGRIGGRFESNVRRQVEHAYNGPKKADYSR